MTTYYQPKTNQLMLFHQPADADFWDKHWKNNDLLKKIKVGKDNILIKKFTNKYLKNKGKVLEGGCGIGQLVYALKNLGYDAYGVDYAAKTIEACKKVCPDLNLFKQDVKNLQFENNFFDGYWSLGVIEHFYDGYEEIIREANRVLKSGGYLFLTFPYLSPLRKLKIKLGLYSTWKSGDDLKNFYQFFLDWKEVREKVEKTGFILIDEQTLDAVKGIKDEILILKPGLQKIYNSNLFVNRVIKMSISKIFSPVAAHGILLIFKKNEKNI